jgi:flagellar basal body rod protein FlgG
MIPFIRSRGHKSNPQPNVEEEIKASQSTERDSRGGLLKHTGHLLDFALKGLVRGKIDFQ